jgi:hypothetical protein
MNAVRNSIVLGIAAAAGALLGLGQVKVAELANITTLGADFGAGDDRVQGVQVTLVAWYCAMAVPLAVTIAGLRRDLGVKVRGAAVLAAAVGTLAAYPFVTGLSGAPLRDDTGPAVLLGVLLGIVGASAVALVPAIGKGLAAYVTLLWVAALVFAPLFFNTVVYAGMVQPLSLDSLGPLGDSLPDLPYNLAYHLPTMLPVAVAILVLAGVVSGVAARRNGRWVRSAAVGAIGPVLAAIVYRLTPGQLYLWNESAGVLVLVVAVCSLLIAATAAALCRKLKRGR